MLGINRRRRILSTKGIRKVQSTKSSNVKEMDDNSFCGCAMSQNLPNWVFEKKTIIDMTETNGNVSLENILHTKMNMMKEY